MRKAFWAMAVLASLPLGGCVMDGIQPVPVEALPQDSVVDSCTGWDHTPPYTDPFSKGAINTPSIIVLGASLSGYPAGSMLQLTLTAPDGRPVLLRGMEGPDGKVSAAAGINQYGAYLPAGPAQLTYPDAAGKPTTVELPAAEFVALGGVQVNAVEKACDAANLAAGRPGTPSPTTTAAAAPPAPAGPLTTWWLTFVTVGVLLIAAAAAIYTFARRAKPRDCSALRAECARLSAIAAKAASAASDASAKAASARSACDAARQQRAAAEKALAKAKADAADTGSWMESEGKRRTSEDLRLEREASRAAYESYKRGELTADQLQEEWRKSGDWEHLEQLRKQEAARRKEKLDSARRDLDSAVAHERSACDTATTASATAQAAHAAADSAAAAAKSACAAADECEKSTPSTSDGRSTGATSTTPSGVTPPAPLLLAPPPARHLRARPPARLPATLLPPAAPVAAPRPPATLQPQRNPNVVKGQSAAAGYWKPAAH